MMRKCPRCGKSLSEDRSRFCDTCGHDMRASVQTGVRSGEPNGRTVPDSVKQGRDKGLYVFSRAAGDGTGFGSSIPVGNSEAPLSGGRGSDRRCGEDPHRVLSLFANMNQFYMQGFAGVLDLQVRNNSSEPLDAVEIRLSGKVAPAGKSGAPLRLEVGETKRRTLPIAEPARGGIEVVRIELRVRKGTRRFVFTAEATLMILERVEKASDIQINAGKLVEIGHAGDKFNLGGVINVDISEMIRAGRIKTANDFMLEYQKLPPEFKELSLEFRSQPRRRWIYLAAGVAIIAALMALVAMTMREHRLKWQAIQQLETRVQAARQDAETSGAPADAVQLWEQAEKLFEGGARAFRQGQLDTASRLWKEAVGKYSDAGEYAGGVARVRTAKDAYHEALAKYDLATLENGGSQAWSDICAAVTFARAADGDFEQAVEWYHRATELLPAAWRIAEAHAEQRTSEPARAYRFEEAVEALLAQIKDRVGGKAEVLRLNQIVGPDETRTKFDVVLENRLVLTMQGERICLAGIGASPTSEECPEVTVSRSQRDRMLVLSGVVSAGGRLTNLDAIQVALDESLQRLLSTRTVTYEQIKKQPSIAGDVVELPPLEMVYSITGMHKSNRVWTSVPVKNGAQLSSGDCFKINFETNEDCFVYVLLYGSAGIAQCLFPHEQIQIANRVEGNKLYALPDGDNWYYLDNERGIETVYLVGSYEPMQDIGGLLRRMNGADRDAQKALSEQIQNGIVSVQTRGLDSETYTVSLVRGVAAVKPTPVWRLKHEGEVIEAIREIVCGEAGVVEVISFEHQ
jgi:tetratricopeptide (TPR) repeat protein